MAITHTSAVRTVFGDTFVTAIGATNAKLKIYSGTPPANAQASLSGNTLLATITTIASGNSGGTVTFTGSSAEPSATAGTAAFFRMTTSADVVIIQGTVATSGGDATIASTTISTGNTVSLTGTNTYTVCA